MLRQAHLSLSILTCEMRMAIGPILQGLMKMKKLYFCLFD